MFGARMFKNVFWIVGVWVPSTMPTARTQGWCWSLCLPQPKMSSANMSPYFHERALPPIKAFLPLLNNHLHPLKVLWPTSSIMILKASVPIIPKYLLSSITGTPGLSPLLKCLFKDRNCLPLIKTKEFLCVTWARMIGWCQGFCLYRSKIVFCQDNWSTMSWGKSNTNPLISMRGWLFLL